MSAILVVLLWLSIGACAGAAWGFASVFPVWGLLRLIDASGRRRNHQAGRRIRSAMIGLSVALPVLLAGLWLVSNRVVGWLELSHGTALQVGVMAGGCGMCAMLWIFIGASLHQTIRDP